MRLRRFKRELNTKCQKAKIVLERIYFSFFLKHPKSGKRVDESSFLNRSTSKNILKREESTSINVRAKVLNVSSASKPAPRRRCIGETEKWV